MSEASWIRAAFGLAVVAAVIFGAAYASRSYYRERASLSGQERRELDEEIRRDSIW